jgi:purine catabolism regulator
MDQGKNSEVLLETLETFFDLNENVTRTAKKMFVHPNTIKYRINRIKDIIGNDYFDNNDNKLKLQISLKMRKYLINEA